MSDRKWQKVIVVVYCSECAQYLYLNALSSYIKTNGRRVTSPYWLLHMHCLLAEACSGRERMITPVSYWSTNADRPKTPRCKIPTLRRIGVNWPAVNAVHRTTSPASECNTSRAKPPPTSDPSAEKSPSPDWTDRRFGSRFASNSARSGSDDRLSIERSPQTAWQCRSRGCFSLFLQVSRAGRSSGGAAGPHSRPLTPRESSNPVARQTACPLSLVLSPSTDSRCTSTVCVYSIWYIPFARFALLRVCAVLDGHNSRPPHRLIPKRGSAFLRNIWPTKTGPASFVAAIWFAYRHGDERKRCWTAQLPFRTFYVGKIRSETSEMIRAIPKCKYNSKFRKENSKKIDITPEHSIALMIIRCLVITM